MIPKVTVLTTVRNGATHISETIASIREQTFTDWEYVLVDDGSDDDTPEIVASFAAQDERIRPMRREQSGGPFVAANHGLAHARGRYIVRTDADDVSATIRIEHQLRHLEAHPEQRACGSHWRLIAASGEPYQSIRAIPNLPKILKWRLCIRGGPPHSTLCIEREALEQVGGYRELPVAQDFRLLCDLSRRNWLGIVPEVLLFYRRHPMQLRAIASELQAELGDEALRDHLAELLADPPAEREVTELHRLTRVGVPVVRGYRLIRKWESWWRHDHDLGVEDRLALEQLGAEARWGFLRTTLRRSPIASSYRRGRHALQRLGRG